VVLMVGGRGESLMIDRDSCVSNPPISRMPEGVPQFAGKKRNSNPLWEEEMRIESRLMP